MKIQAVYHHDPLFATAWTLSLVGVVGYLVVVCTLLALPQYRDRFAPTYWRDWQVNTENFASAQIPVFQPTSGYVVMATVQETTNTYTGLEGWSLTGETPTKETTFPHLTFDNPYDLVTTTLVGHTRPPDPDNWLVVALQPQGFTLYTYNTTFRQWRTADTRTWSNEWTAQQGVWLELEDGRLVWVVWQTSDTTDQLQGWTFRGVSHGFQTEVMTWTPHQLGVTRIIRLASQQHQLVVSHANKAMITQGIRVLNLYGDTWSTAYDLEVPETGIQRERFGYRIGFPIADAILATSGPHITLPTQVEGECALVYYHQQQWVQTYALGSALQVMSLTETDGWVTVVLIRRRENTLNELDQVLWVGERRPTGLVMTLSLTVPLYQVQLLQTSLPTVGAFTDTVRHILWPNAATQLTLDTGLMTQRKC